MVHFCWAKVILIPVVERSYPTMVRVRPDKEKPVITGSGMVYLYPQLRFPQTASCSSMVTMTCGVDSLV